MLKLVAMPPGRASLICFSCTLLFRTLVECLQSTSHVGLQERSDTC